MTHSELVEKFRDQLGYIQVSSRAYDDGFEPEGIRVGQALRVLFHTKPPKKPKQDKGSKSVVTYLKMEDWPMLSSSGGKDVHGHVKIHLAPGAPVPVRAVPKLGDHFNQTTILGWWNEPVFFFGGSDVSRADIALCAANKDGGAHVDEKLPFYNRLTSGLDSLILNPQNLIFPGPAPYDQTKPQQIRNLHVAILRQFAHDVLVSAQHFQWLQKLSVNPEPIQQE
jgi:hypothetical protein